MMSKKSKSRRVMLCLMALMTFLSIVAYNVVKNSDKFTAIVNNHDEYNCQNKIVVHKDRLMIGVAG